MGFPEAVPPPRDRRMRRLTGRLVLCALVALLLGLGAAGARADLTVDIGRNLMTSWCALEGEPVSGTVSARVAFPECLDCEDCVRWIVTDPEGAVTKAWGRVEPGPEPTGPPTAYYFGPMKTMTMRDGTWTVRAEVYEYDFGQSEPHGGLLGPFAGGDPPSGGGQEPGTSPLDWGTATFEAVNLTAEDSLQAPGLRVHVASGTGQVEQVGQLCVAVKEPGILGW